MARIRLDHTAVHVTGWERSNAFYRDVVGAELVEWPGGGSDPDGSLLEFISDE